MNTPGNGFKQALARGEPQIGLWLALANPYAAEVVAGAGFDWLTIDGEHVPNTLPTILATLQVLAAYPVHAVVRVPDGNPTFLKQVLELGATTVLVPTVESAEQARELVRAVRYPPQGFRGVGASLARSSRWGRFGDYLARANDSVCLLVQIETRDGAANAAAIAAVDGVDGILIGPSDLAASMGLLGQPTHAEVRALVERTIPAIVACGRAAGIYCADEALARQYLAAGASFVALGADASILAAASSALAARFRAAIAGRGAPERR
jgi:4-hydroxy-2-oxoheptanedioate aldolase